MAAPLLLLDCNFLCYRAHYSHKGLSFGDYQTGVIFGFLNDLVSLQDRFLPGAMAMCWDFGVPHREVDYPDYKLARRLKRQNASDEEKAFKEYFDEQVKDLRTKFLKQLGYKNIFWQRGYEADDLIGYFCTCDKYSRVRKIIVSGDSDYYQLLGGNTSIYSPRREGVLITQDWFEREFGVTPSQYLDAKAIAGCTTDGIEGIQGVGEKKACCFLNGTLQEKTKAGKPSKAFRNIVAGKAIWDRNRHLVRIPYPGVKDMILRRDNVTAGSWEQLAKKLGMKTLSDKAPIKKKRKGLGVY